LIKIPDNPVTIILYSPNGSKALEKLAAALGAESLLDAVD
jgi:hypothetical protein